MADNGYILLYRTIDHNALWESEEPYCKRAAWVDLLMMANHSENTIVIGNKELIVKRGQRFTSIRKLSNKWHWGKDKVSAFLNLLVSLNMIRKNKTHNGTLLTIVNYDKYQPLKGGRPDTNKDTNKDTTKDTNKDTIKPQTINDKKNDKRMNNKKPSPSAESLEDKYAGMTDDEITQAIIAEGWTDLEGEEWDE